MLKRSLYSTLAILMILCAFTFSTALAENKLEIVQARQYGDQIVLYTLITDADSNAVYSSGLDEQRVRVSTDMHGDARIVSVQPFAQSGEGVAYTVVLDINTYALNANRLSVLQDALKMFLNMLRDSDRVMLLVTGKNGTTPVTDSFEGDRLTISYAIDAIASKDKTQSPALFKAVDRALDTFSSTNADFPARKAVLVLTYGQDDGSMAADVLAQKASQNGVPVYFITLKGKNSEGKVREVDVADIDRIARLSHGRVIDGTQDLNAAVKLMNDYIMGTQVIVALPSKEAWNALSADWNISAQIDDYTVTNSADAKYPILLTATATPIPSPTPTIMPITPTPAAVTPTPVIMLAPDRQYVVSIVWVDENNENKTRPETIVASLMKDGLNTDKMFLLNESNGWKAIWDSLPNDTSVYSVSLANVDRYNITASSVSSDQTIFTMSMTSADFLTQLLSPPLLYMLIGGAVLLLALIVILIVRQTKRSHIHMEEHEEEPDASQNDYGNIRDAISEIGSDGETLGLFDDDPEATLPMGINQCRINATITGGGETRQQTLTISRELMIGRSADCGLVLKDPRVSRKHCKLIWQPDGLFIMDMSSSSGTFMNNQPVLTKMPVRTGAMLSLGNTQILLSIQG